MFIKFEHFKKFERLQNFYNQFLATMLASNMVQNLKEQA